MAATAKMRDQIRELEMKERSSKSLLANVLGKLWMVHNINVCVEKERMMITANPTWALYL